MGRTADQYVGLARTVLFDAGVHVAIQWLHGEYGPTPVFPLTPCLHEAADRWNSETGQSRKPFAASTINTLWGSADDYRDTVMNAIASGADDPHRIAEVTYPRHNEGAADISNIWKQEDAFFVAATRSDHPLDPEHLRRELRTRRGTVISNVFRATILSPVLRARAIARLDRTAHALRDRSNTDLIDAAEYDYDSKYYLTAWIQQELRLTGMAFRSGSDETNVTGMVLALIDGAHQQVLADPSSPERLRPFINPKSKPSEQDPIAIAAQGVLDAFTVPVDTVVASAVEQTVRDLRGPSATQLTATLTARILGEIDAVTEAGNRKALWRHDDVLREKYWAQWAQRRTETLLGVPPR